MKNPRIILLCVLIILVSTHSLIITIPVFQSTNIAPHSYSHDDVLLLTFLVSLANAVW